MAHIPWLSFPLYLLTSRGPIIRHDVINAIDILIESQLLAMSRNLKLGHNLPACSLLRHQASTPQPPFPQFFASRTSQTVRSASTTPTKPDKSSTHYTLFPSTLPKGPPPAGPFPIDTRALRREFLQLQTLAHPDRHTGSDKARAEGTSALINEAYKTLSSPLHRAQYILSLNGIDVAEDETAKVDDPELLGEVLDAREVIEGAEEEEELAELRMQNEERIRASENSLGDLCERGDWGRAKEEAVRLRYWVNIREALNGWEKGAPVVLVH